MTYELNENRFYEISGINQIKTFSYFLGNKRIDGENFNASIDLNLTYFDALLTEKYTQLSLPITINLDSGNVDDVELKNIELMVVENQGVTLDFVLEINLADDVVIKQEIEDEYQESLVDALNSRESTTTEENDIATNEDNMMEVVSEIASTESPFEEQELVEAAIESRDDSFSDTTALEAQEVLTEEDNRNDASIDIDMVESTVNIEEEANNFLENDYEAKSETKIAEYKDDKNFIDYLGDSYAVYHIITIKDESEIDKLASKYNLSIEYLFKAKRDGNRIIVHDQK